MASQERLIVEIINWIMEFDRIWEGSWKKIHTRICINIGELCPSMDDPDYGTFGFGMRSSYSRSCSSNFSLKGLVHWFLVFLILLASWLFLPPWKLESIEVGLLRWPSSNFSLNPRLDFGVLSAKQVKYHLQDARKAVGHSFKRSFLYLVFLALGSH
jgi:hypothetical protein